MKVKIFGIGAAGNKAAIEAVEQKVVPMNDVFLVNTSLKDIPEKYKKSPDNIIKFGSGLGGCGKEPIKGHKAIVEAIKKGDVDLSEYIDVDTKMVAIVTSVEGGTGSGATPIIAKYFVALNMPVHVFCFIGFQDETRGINNTLRFFKELPEGIVLHTIRNSSFIDYTGVYSKAEAAANIEFAKQIEVLTGAKMIPSSQNIDEMDHYKICTTPGYMDIRCNIPLNGIKNIDMSNAAIIKSFDDMASMEYAKAAKRLAVIINADKACDHIDNSFEVIKRYTGEPFEVFRHVQNNESCNKEFMDIIIAGLPYPEDGIKDMANKFKDLKSKLNSESKEMSDIFDDIDFDEEDETETNLKTLKNPSDAIAAILGEKPIGGKIHNNHHNVIDNIYDNDEEDDY